jgi:2,4-dienoyl-CoA reductase-like NADH-dependent reductase (Old Yellow Enzyme family)
MAEPRLLGSPFTLPCGVTLPNRIIKAAMTEQMATKQHAPTDQLIRLYEEWGKGGAAVNLTGNVMVDHRSLEGPRNVAVEDERDLALLTEWAARAQANGSALWMQISHPGRQTPGRISSEIVAPSAVKIGGSLAPLFKGPRALTEEEIHGLIARFVTTACIAKKAGFAGIQIHSAHGYLNSQFLSPRTNQRTDQWGGSLENRMRLLMTIIRDTREVVGADFPVALKLNSADFQRGGFSEEESMAVVAAAGEAGIDLLEISGGNYENPMMMRTGESPEVQRESTVQREAFFLDYARKVRGHSKVPLMLTGGLRTVSLMEQILEDGDVDFIGLARPLALDRDFPRKAIAGEVDVAPSANIRTGIRSIDDMLQSFWHQEQFRKIAAGDQPDPRAARTPAMIKGMWNVFGP